MTWEEERGPYSLKFTTRQVLHFLVDEVVELKGLDDIGLELRRQESGLDLLEEQLPNSAFELGRDGLWLHANLHLGDLLVSVGLESTGQKAAESGLHRLVTKCVEKLVPCKLTLPVPFSPIITMISESEKSPESMLSLKLPSVFSIAG